MADNTAFANNFFTSRKSYPLKDNNGIRFGTAIITYQVQRFRDVSDLASHPAYLVSMTQRVLIPNKNSYVPGPQQGDSYLNYPAILTSEVKLETSNDPDIVLRSVFPRTLNARVSTSLSQSEAANTSHSVQSSSGSNQNTVNSYGVSTSGGLSGTNPLFSMTSQYGQSFSSGTMQSQTTANSSGSNHGFAASQSMSIKDWSSYGLIDDSGNNPSWLFGQSYPWDVLQHNQVKNNGINLPNYVIAQMYDSDMVLPPSQLSQFGLDFTMTASWMLVYTEPIAHEETVTFTHKFTSITASHQLSGDSSNPVTATLQSASDAASATIVSQPLSLSTYGLVPIVGAHVARSSAIGFPAASWTIAPTDVRGPCKVVSPGDTLQVEAIGFDRNMHSDFSAAKTAVTLTFKVPDHNLPYTLAMMHWIGQGNEPVVVNWEINGRATGSFIVDSAQGEGGGNNTHILGLRNTDFSSINFHDYLIVGTNKLTLLISRGGSKAALYCLHAIAIGIDE